MFPHPMIHKLTWNSPNGPDRNQIDHILVNRKWRRSLIDVKVHGSADVGSDHHDVIAQLKVKLRSACKQLTSNKHCNTDKLKDQKVKNTFFIQLENRFEALASELPEAMENTELNKLWENVKEVYSDTSKNCLGYRTNTARKKWLAPATMEAVEKRCNIKLKELNSYSERLKNKYKDQYKTRDKEVKKLARKDKRAYNENIC